MKRLKVLFLFLVLVLFSHSLHAATFNVTNSSELTDALGTASTNNEDNAINLAAGTYSSVGGFSYSGTEHSLTLTGANIDATDDATVISASAGDGITFSFTGSVHVIGITVQDSDTGLIFLNSGDFELDSVMNVTIENSHFTGNSDGGVSIHNQFIVGTVEVLNNVFDYNTKTTQGAGLYAYTQGIDSPITLKGNIFDHNTPPDPSQPHALLVGGGAWLKTDAIGSSPITVGGSAEGEGNTFTSNTALASGGISVYSLGGISFVGNTLIGNSADPDDFSATGGGVGIAYAGTGEFAHNVVQDNSAFSSGGLTMGPLPAGVDSSLVLNANLFSGNSSKDCGGANLGYYLRQGPLQVTNNIFVNNFVETALATAGGLCITEPNNPFDDPEDINVINNTFANNAAALDPFTTYVGGLSISPQQAGVQVNVYNNIFYKNISALDMKDVYVLGADPAWTGMNFYNNDVVNADASNTTNVCIEDPNNGYVVACNDGDDFATSALIAAKLTAVSTLYDVDPAFLGLGGLADQYSLSVNSPLIQAGNASAPSLPTYDYTGTVPMDTPNPDLGALQYCVPILNPTVTSASETITLGENISWTVFLANSAPCVSNDNTATFTFTNSEYLSIEQIQASISSQMASAPRLSASSVSCSGSGTSATCTITQIPNDSSVNLNVFASTVALGEVSLSVSVSNTLGTASASGTASATVVSGSTPVPLGDLSGAGCTLNKNISNHHLGFWMFVGVVLLPILKMRKGHCSRLII